MKNTGQCQSGVFLLKLQVRIQSPQNGIDEIVDIGTKKINSIPPAKTGSSSGTTTASFSFTTADYAWAQYNFIATADSTGHIQEWDEANNEKTSLDQIVDTLDFASPKLFIVHPDDKTSLDTLPKFYGNGWFRQHDTAVDGKEFMVFTVPHMVPEN